MRVTVILEDQKISVDGEALQFSFVAPPNLAAIQWHDTHGTAELKIGGAEDIPLEYVQPYIDAFNAEKERIAALPPVVPVATVPQVVSRYQGCAALYDAGRLDGVEAYFASTSATAEEKLAWRTITEMRRTSPMTLKMAGLLGMTEVQVDELFILAATKLA